MRRFIVLGHTAPTDPDFDLDDLAGGAGRLDVLARCVNSAFFLSHAIRENVRVYLVLSDTVTIKIEGVELRYMNPDERNIASLLRQALEARADAIGHSEVESTPGIYVSNRGFESVLKAAAREGAIVQLHEDGDPLASVEPPENPAFVLSDHLDFTAEERDLLAEYADYRVSVGPKALHADHTISVVHNYLDTDGYSF
ncbi:tRNA (pseudouridine(54)-N(1))-methyltransferase TrmY [Halodesulfurarchaeum sp. HSR-GB]|uniref:tRNA (pseudouridine(54)-N(1))-methyltransferase TrmY n=1 Tax=Halodesulfurarchaeum sp. HSR-GB TaxID=3074077 RepID=UPI00285AE6E0|nr:tRNA (pseudouridine(54)-N(1))-methyltransferase TrmY [Halodesulfurarchaeum sp. HSR-GB]MDR5656009.1 tRNA (pseudouridine(54)-N(1))-methyltransferase TrmY [Halodesulfurarchaeum sp. HSR-GB]